MQTTNAAFDNFRANRSKRIDYLIAIAGHDTIYSVANDSYTLADTADSGLSDFTTIKQLANIPKGAGSKMKGTRPEDGGQTIDSLTVEILDKPDLTNGGKRELSDLVSRAAYVLGNQSGHTTTLHTAISASATAITLEDGTNFAAGSVCYIGQEAIYLGDKVVNGDGTSTYGGTASPPCIRGYRLTDATPHAAAVIAYAFLPNLYRRPLYVFKGSADWGTTANFVRAFGGIITGDEKNAEKVKLKASANTWEMYANGVKNIVDLAQYSGTEEVRLGVGGAPDVAIYSGDYTFSFETTLSSPTGLDDGHYLLNLDGSWMAITAISSETAASDGFTTVCNDATLVKGLNGSPNRDHNENEYQLKIGWSNVTFSSDGTVPAGDEPAKLILKFLLSVTGDGSNNATYDVFKQGIGLGIPASKVDITSFTDIMAQKDYDSSIRVFFLFTEPVPAKEFIEEQLCKPFGFSLVTGNDGKIKLIRHRSPGLFYIGQQDYKIAYAQPTGTATHQAALATGCYTPDALATEIARALNAASSGFGCTFDASTKTFTITNAGTFDLKTAPDNLQAYIGFTTATNQTSLTGSALSLGADATLSEDDVTGLVAVDSRDLQIASVIYWTNYDWDAEKFRLQKRYIDAETVNLGDELGAREYEIEAKGLLQASKPIFTWVTHLIPPASGCTGSFVHPSSSNAIDFDGSWAHLYALSLIHRYKQPPLVLKGRLTSKWNHLEIGDVIELGFSIKGVIADQERGTETLTNRFFEIAAARPVFETMETEVVLVGHRYQGAF